MPASNSTHEQQFEHAVALGWIKRELAESRTTQKMARASFGSAMSLLDGNKAQLRPTELKQVRRQVARCEREAERTRDHVEDAVERNIATLTAALEQATAARPIIESLLGAEVVAEADRLCIDTMDCEKQAAAGDPHADVLLKRAAASRRRVDEIKRRLVTG